ILYPPSGPPMRLGLPEVVGNRSIITAKDLPWAGVYRLKTADPADVTNTDVTLPMRTLEKEAGTPLAVVPDLRESEDLSCLTDAQIDGGLGSAPFHMTGGSLDNSGLAAADRLNREWTLWLLTIVLILVLAETGLAYLCGRSW